MSVLVGASEVARHLGLEDVDQVLRDLIDRVEAFFVADCGREEEPFQEAQAARVERQNGTGMARLWLDYPVSVLTTVKLGYNSTVPDETLSVSDRTKLVWDAGQRWIERVDGGVFGHQGQPSYIEVKYDAAADVPIDAGLAIVRGVAAIYEQRGAEDVTNETIGGYRADLASVLAGDAVWQRAVARHRVVHV